MSHPGLLNRRADKPMTNWKRTQGQLMIYKDKNTEMWDRATRSTIKIGVNSGVPEWQTVPAPHVAPIVLLLFQTRLIVIYKEMTRLWSVMVIYDKRNTTNNLFAIQITTKTCLQHTSIYLIKSKDTLVFVYLVDCQ